MNRDVANQDLCVTSASDITSVVLTLCKMGYFFLTNECADDLLVLWWSNICNIDIFIGYGETKPTYKSIFLVFRETVCVLISTVLIVYYTGMLLFVFSSPPWMPPVLAGRRARSTELYLSSDLTYFAVHHPSLPPPWQFSLGCEFNIVQNRICIYISFFNRSGRLWKLSFFGRNQVQPI